MIWTKDKPTKPGEWYWYRDMWGDGFARVDDNDILFLSVDYDASGSGEYAYKDLIEYNPMFSSEPIPQPEEPTDGERGI